MMILRRIDSRSSPPIQWVLSIVSHNKSNGNDHISLSLSNNLLVIFTFKVQSGHSLATNAHRPTSAMHFIISLCERDVRMARRGHASSSQWSQETDLRVACSPCVPLLRRPTCDVSRRFRGLMKTTFSRCTYSSIIAVEL